MAQAGRLEPNSPLSEKALRKTRVTPLQATSLTKGNIYIYIYTCTHIYIYIYICMQPYMDTYKTARERHVRRRQKTGRYMDRPSHRRITQASEKRLRPPILQGGTLGQEPFSSRVLSCTLMFKKEGRLNAQSNLTLQGTFCCVNLQCSDTYK